MAIKTIKKEAKTELQKMYVKFWTLFNNYSAKDNAFNSEFKHHPYADLRQYQDYAVNHGVYHLTTHVDLRKKICKVGVYFRDVEAWDSYYVKRDIIERNIGIPLVWAKHKTKASAYVVQKISATNEKEWNLIFQFFISTLIALKIEFSSYVNQKTKTYWLISSNDRVFRISDCLKDNEYIDWQGSFSPTIGDIVFIYRTKPFQRICYMMEVTKVNVPYRNTMNDIKYWGKNHLPKDRINSEELYHRLKLISESESLGLHLSKLQQQGMTGVPQGPRKLSGKLLDYVLSIFQPQHNEYNEYEDPKYFEGALKKVYVNRYERDHNARDICIKMHGCKCAICGMDFEKIYGELGKGFIHVHHITPIASIGKTYQLNPEKELIPVCPNCHAMLHRKDPPFKPDELRSKLNSK